MDEDEKAEAARHSLQARGAYDTFGSVAAEREVARAAAAGAERAGAVPSLVPTELIAPVADSVGEHWFA